MDILQNILAMLLGGGVIGLIEFLIRRKDERSDKNSEVLSSIKALDKKVDEKFDELNSKIDAVDAKGDKTNAISSRIRILRFNDELQRGEKHTKESWDQAMSDVTEYENYCKDHPLFQNGKTVATIAYITSEYKERLDKHDFL